MKSKIIFTNVKSISIVLLFFLVILQGCTKSPRKEATGNVWQILMPESNYSETNEDGILISDSTIESTSGSQIYKIEWIDNNTFNLNYDDLICKVVLKLSSENILQAFILYDKEPIPKTDEEWSILLNDNRVMTLLKKGTKSSGSSNSYSLNVTGFGDKGVKKILVPGDSIPIAGDYWYFGTNGSSLTQMIRVIYEPGGVKFKAGENSNKLFDCKLVSYGQANEFMDYGGIKGKLSTFRLESEDGNYDIQYLKNGCLSVLFSGFRSSSEEQVPDIFIRNQKRNSSSAKQYIEDLLLVAKMNKLVFGEGEKIGKIVKMEVKPQPPFSGRGATPIEVPNGKMWTPLFYTATNAAIKRGFDITIYTESYGKGGYSVASSYKFKVGVGNFVSNKYSKQNFRAITGNGLQAVAIYCWLNEPFNLFFLEENIH